MKIFFNLSACFKLSQKYRSQKRISITEHLQFSTSSSTTQSSIPVSAYNLPRVRLFTRPGCTLCAPVKYLIHRVRHLYSFQYEEIDISEPQHSEWLKLYDYHIPVVHLNEIEISRHFLKEAQLISALTSNKNRQQTSETESCHKSFQP